MRETEGKRKQPDELLGHVFLQLAICHYVGFGVSPNISIAMVHLTSSCKYNGVARACFNRVLQALWNSLNDEQLAGTGWFVDKDIDWCIETDLDTALEACSLDSSYMALRLQKSSRSSKIIHPSQTTDSRIDLSLNGLDLADSSPQAISGGLMNACKQGDFTASIEFAKACTEVSWDSRFPTPVHWLIMFDDDEV